MGQCPKCGYFRRPEDDEFVPASECPKCGVIYSRSRPVESLQAGFSSRPAEPARSGGGGGGVFKLLLLVVLAVAGFYGWRYYYPSSTEETVAYKSEFTAVPWFLDAPENTVVIVGPTWSNAAGVRTRQLADRVSSKDIPYRLTNSINIPRDAEQKLLRGWQEVARGQQPIVFINGRAKANPTLEQVIAEYEHSG